MRLTKHLRALSISTASALAITGGTWNVSQPHIGKLEIEVESSAGTNLRNQDIVRLDVLVNTAMC
jgi:hypothetical protein